MSFTFMDMEKNVTEMFEYQKNYINSVNTLLNMEDVQSGTTEKDVVYTEDKMSLYHYKPVAKKINATPTLIVYALVNRQYMMDLQEDRSMIRNLLEAGIDLYIIDWGYPTADDKYITLDDYIEGYLHNAVQQVMKNSGAKKINLMGICQGGTFSVMYSALHPEKIKNLVAMVAPIDFEAAAESDNGLLFKWSQYMDVDQVVDTFGLIPGEWLNTSFDMLKPFQLMVDKYISLGNKLYDPAKAANYIRMEKWSADSPDQAGEAFRRFIKDFYQENKLIKNEIYIDGKNVDLKKITMPVLTVFGEMDHIVPAAASIPLNDYVGSKDKELASFPVGHIGMYVSSKSGKLIAPKLAKWLTDRDK